jgi:transcriptional regulator with GAF, ATPase, and Fis domain
LITIDADKQFVTREFKQYAVNMRITIKTISVETHHSIEMMKRYHDSLRRVYAIITTAISSIDFEIALQMTFKVINDSIEFDDLILTLLVFEAYSRMIEMNVSSSTITQRAIAMKKTMKEVQKFIATRQMNDFLNTRNDLIITLIHELSLNSSVLIFRESKDINQSET